MRVCVKERYANSTQLAVHLLISRPFALSSFIASNQSVSRQIFDSQVFHFFVNGAIAEKLEDSVALDSVAGTYVNWWWDNGCLCRSYGRYGCEVLLAFVSNTFSTHHFQFRCVLGQQVVLSAGKRSADQCCGVDTGLKTNYNSQHAEKLHRALLVAFRRSCRCIYECLSSVCVTCNIHFCVYVFWRQSGRTERCILARPAEGRQWHC